MLNDVISFTTGLKYLLGLMKDLTGYKQIYWLHDWVTQFYLKLIAFSDWILIREDPYLEVNTTNEKEADKNTWSWNHPHESNFKRKYLKMRIKLHAHYIVIISYYPVLELISEPENPLWANYVLSIYSVERVLKLRSEVEENNSVTTPKITWSKRKPSILYVVLYVWVCIKSFVDHPI